MIALAPVLIIICLLARRLVIAILGAALIALLNYSAHHFFH